MVGMHVCNNTKAMPIPVMDAVLVEAKRRFADKQHAMIAGRYTDSSSCTSCELQARSCQGVSVDLAYLSTIGLLCICLL